PDEPDTCSVLSLTINVSPPQEAVPPGDTGLIPVTLLEMPAPRKRRIDAARLGAFALDDLESEVEPDRTGVLAADAFQQRLGPAAADLQARQPQAGQARDGVLQDVEVVEARDGDAPRHLPAAALRLEQRADGEHVAGEEDRIDIGRARQHVHHG